MADQIKTATGKAEVKGTTKKNVVKLDDNNWYKVEDFVQPYLNEIKKGDEVELTYKRVKEGKFWTNLVSKLVKKGATTTKDETVEKIDFNEPKTGTKRDFYGSPEDVRGKQKGCALGAAATVVSGMGIPEIKEAGETTTTLANLFYEWLKESE